MTVVKTERERQMSSDCHCSTTILNDIHRWTLICGDHRKLVFFWLGLWEQSMHVRVHVIFNGTWHNQEVSRWRSIWSPEKNISGRTGGKLLLPEVDWKRANEADDGQRSSFWFVRYGYCLITAVSSQCRGEQELVQTTKNGTWQVYIKVTEWPYCCEATALTAGSPCGLDLPGNITLHVGLTLTGTLLNHLHLFNRCYHKHLHDVGALFACPCLLIWLFTSRLAHLMLGWQEANNPRGFNANLQRSKISKTTVGFTIWRPHLFSP